LSYLNNRDLHSFPTRRSSDLNKHLINLKIILKILSKIFIIFLIIEFDVSSSTFSTSSNISTSISNLSSSYPRTSLYVPGVFLFRSEEHTSELQSRENLVCRLL